MRKENPIKITATILGLVLLIAIPIYQYSIFNNLKNYGDTTTCELIEVRPRIVCRYTVKGKEYISKKMSSPLYSSLEKGEMYRLLYNSKNPKEKDIIYEKPVLSNDKVFINTLSINVDIEEKWLPFKGNVKEVMFTYEVAGETFTRYQRVDKKYTICNYCGSFLVKYRKGNLKIAYIFLDKRK